MDFDIDRDESLLPRLTNFYPCFQTMFWNLLLIKISGSNGIFMNFRDRLGTEIFKERDDLFR